MKNNDRLVIYKSFRFKIIIYTILSISYAVLTEGALGMIAYALYQSFRGSHHQVTEFQMANPGVNLHNSLQRPANAVYRNHERKSMFFLMILILLLVGIVLFALYFLLLTRHISANLNKVIKGIRLISQGELDARITIHGEDEFAMIGEQFNVMAEDIAKRIENERKMERTKNTLITNVAHDLRTPLTSIIGYLDLTRNHPELDEGTRQHYISIAYDKSKRLEKLIGDLFSFTKFSSGEMVPVFRKIDLIKFVEQMLDEFYPLFMDAELKYEFYSSSESLMIMADGDLLARAFSNLFSNAVKYGKDGKKIVVRVAEEEREAVISVINYGKIIPPNDLEYIFDRFYRVENSRNSETGGTGLGLAIARTVVQMHKGTIQAMSDETGTVFEVRLGKGAEDETKT